MLEKSMMTLLMASLICAVSSSPTSAQVSGKDNNEEGIHMQVENRIFSRKVTINRTYEYVLLFPNDYHRTEDEWPLLLFLDSGSGRGTDIERIRDYVIREVLGTFDELPFVVVAPQIPDDTAWCPHALNQLLEGLIAELRIDNDRVYVTGWSRGGYGTWELAATYPDAFAAIMPISSREVHPTSRLKDIHTRICHGGKVKSIPVESAESMLRSLEKKNADVELIVYPEAGHGGAAAEAYSNSATWDWLLRQQRRSSVLEK